MKKTSKKPDNIRNNPVAKYMNKFNKPKVIEDQKRNKPKHKRDYYGDEE